MINNLRLDKAFLTSAAFSAEFGMSIQGPDVVSVLQEIIKNTRQTIGLFPHQKMGIESVMKICDAEMIDMVITDSESTEEEINSIEDKGIEVVVV
jgi:DeoR/GlpR family transcriptional regulator of sugar metabolism